MSARHLLANAATRSIQAMFPGFFFGAQKHNHAADFGYPDQVSFELAFDAYCRNPLARAAVDKTVGKTWEDNPYLQEFQRDGTEGGDQGETGLEADIRQRFADLRIWQHLAECDRRSLVGCYSGLILRFADSKAFKEPVDTVSGGLMGLVEVIPAWEGQLTVSTWDTDEKSEGYGQPTMFSFAESAVGQQKQPRTFEIHPDRVIVWSPDGTLNGRSALEPGYNALLDMEKIRGGGGEGFWKNAKSGLSLEIDKDAKIENMAQAMGVPVAEVVDKIDEQVEGFNKGFDKSLLLSGIKATPMQVNLPSPEHFFAVAAQSFAASWSIPMKVLIGSQTGERASTEDSEEWAKVNMGRRTNQAVPAIMTFVNRLERVKVLPQKDWFLSWTDLTESSMGEKIDRAVKMADVNSKQPSGEIVFTGDDIRAVVGMEPLSDAERFRDEADPAEEQDALDLPQTEDQPAPAA
ncbi:anti-CBASS protein Acb1 family protein [Brevundimonas sp.]|uniref:anti-CBASS protein Acb1 family protein n=1 Tax=Brevundimonas sp. TaxID=1871086 RepID=UPI00289DE73F|nr:anti-CBASS Acb1 family protein [Brevundimonas sp.]